MEGDFSLLGPIDLLQLVAQSGRDGVFLAFALLCKSQIFIRAGWHVHAEWLEVQGVEGYSRRFR